MASKGKYLKLNLGPSDKVTGRNSAVGCTVIADYLADNNRTIVLERPASAQRKPAAKRKANAAPKPSAVERAMEGQFPGTGAANG